ncbi:MAG: hypothetical protein D3924_03890 [Candidatus Electrothrix sp. AR4]|nr:hypothetical protein [Candidatus Electrothrix sp. AR4]
MRKGFVLQIVSFFLVFVLLSSAYAECKKGDANMDGDIDHADLYEIKEIFRSGSTCEKVVECADYDGDGSVTVLDIRGVLGEIINNCEPGDANTSGHLTFADICIVEEMITAKGYSKCADCDTDGKLTPADLVCIRGKLHDEKM